MVEKNKARQIKVGVDSQSSFVEDEKMIVANAEAVHDLLPKPLHVFQDDILCPSRISSQLQW